MKEQPIGEAVHTRVVTTREESKSRRERVIMAIRQRFANARLSRLSTEFWANAEAQVDDWVTDYVRSSQEALGLADQTDLPAPRELPTAWHMHAFLMARMVLSVGLNRRIGDGDMYDAHHYAAACTGDLLVTDDIAFRETLERVPRRPIDIKTFAEFVESL